MDTNKLIVNTDDLFTYGKYLIETKTNIFNQLNDMNNKMSKITDGWNDADGRSFASAFASFIREAKKISYEAGTLGTYAKKEANKYNAAVNKAMRKFGVNDVHD